MKRTWVRFDGPIFGAADNPCEKAALVERVAHLVGPQAHGSVELITRRRYWHRSSEGNISAYDVVTLQ